MKLIVFDMDGTIADLFKVNNWLERLRASDPTPYSEAEPIYNMEELNNLLLALKDKGYRIAVTSWLSKDSTPEYSEAVRKAKREWLNRQGFPYDEIHLIKYGATKQDATRHHKCEQILIDDNAKIRKGWHGPVIDANNDIIAELKKLR